MPQNLATLNAGSLPLDWGVQIVFDAAKGMRAEGRVDSPNYRGPWFDGLTSSDVTVTDVADDYQIPVPPKPPASQPNNPGNPYFGKLPLIPKDFWGLVLQVFIGTQGSNAAGLDRMARLLESKRAQPIIKIADSVATIDPDDAQGAFLQMAGLLTTVKHEDGAGLLMEPAEFGAIMQAWR